MALVNKHRGEVAIRIGERDCVLRFGWLAISQLQEKFGDSFEVSVATALGNSNVDAMAEILEIGLAERQPDLTKAAIIEASPPISLVVEKIGVALRYSFQGVGEPDKPDENPTNPGPLKRWLQKMFFWMR